MKLKDIMNESSINEKIDKRVLKISKGVVGAVKIDLEHIEESLSEDGVAEARDYVRYAMDRLNQLDKVLKRIK